MPLRFGRTRDVVAFGALAAASCVGTVVPAPTGTDHPANPDAWSATFTPVEPVFVADGGGPQPAPSAHKELGVGGHGEMTNPHAGHGTPAREPPRSAKPEHDPSHAADTTPHHEPPAASKEAPTATADAARVDALVREYLALGSALAANDVPRITSGAREVHAAAKELAQSEDRYVRDAAGQVAELTAKEPADVGAARESFKKVSAKLIELMPRTPPGRDVAPALREFHCPMAGASWLQVSETAANPYFGGKMPRCGSIVRVIEPRAESGR